MKRAEIKRNERQLYRLVVFKDDHSVFIEPVSIKAWICEDDKQYPVFEDEYADFSLNDVYDEDDVFFYSLKRAFQKAFEINTEKISFAIGFDKSITFADLEKSFKED